MSDKIAQQQWMDQWRRSGAQRLKEGEREKQGERWRGKERERMQGKVEWIVVEAQLLMMMVCVATWSLTLTGFGTAAAAADGWWLLLG